MEIISSSNPNSWFAHLEDVDDPMLLQEFVGNCLVDYPTDDTGMGNLLDDPDLHYTFSTGSECNSSTAVGDINNSVPKHHPTSPNINSNSNAESNQLIRITSLSPEDNADCHPTTKPTKRPRRQPDQCQNHIIAERQRRQNLSQRFIALSALIPGLKKMDKTSVLGKAITHMKELKDKLKILEEENAKRKVDSVVVIQRSRVTFENETNSSTTNDTNHSSLSHDEQLPEVEARFSNTSVLIKIHCHMRNGILSKIINHIENLNLTVSNTCSMPFNSATLDITIMTRMEAEFDMRPQEVVANLRSIF